MADEQDRWRELGVWLESVMASRGLSKLELARLSGVAFGTINDLVNGGRDTPSGWRLPNPFDATLTKLANALGRTEPERRSLEAELLERAGGTYRQRNPDLEDRWRRPRQQQPEPDSPEGVLERLERVERELLELQRERLAEEERRRTGGG